MIFLFDIQKDYSEGKTLINSAFILKKAHQAYNFLYDLKGSVFNSIEKIIVLNTEKSLNIKTIENILATYSSDPRGYGNNEAQIPDLHSFPPVDKLLDKSRKLKIHKLLSCAEVIDNVSTINADKYLFYLPLCFKKSLDLINSLPNENIVVYANSSTMRSKSFSGLKEIKAEAFKKISNSLKTSQSLLAHADIDPFEVRSQHPKELIECFDNSFLSSLKEVKDGRTRVIIKGSDPYLILRAVNYILESETPYYYDLSRGVPFIDKHSSGPMVFFNADKLEDLVEQKKLYDAIKDIDRTKRYIILHYNTPQHIKYFLDYSTIQLPSKQEIDTIVTGLFISLLIEYNLFDGLDYKLLSLIKTNCLKNLLQGCTSVEALDKIVRKINKVTESDLLENVEFWCNIDLEMQTLGQENNSDVEEVIPESVIFESDGSNWTIFGLGKRFTVPYNEFLGLKYIVAIIKYHYIRQQEIDIEELREIVLRYAEGHNRIKQSDDELSIDNLRRNIGDAIIKLKKKYWEFESFIDNHIYYSGGQYSFKPKGMETKKTIRCEIIDPHWKNEYLKKSK